MHTINEHQTYQPTPFLKWAGGKRWLVSEHFHLFPESYNNYFEPFLGSASVFFKLAPKRAFLSDACQDLIDAYLAIQEDWQAVQWQLEKHQKLHSKEYYYKIRSQNPRLASVRAARFIYLNRTCWNGLYRVNLKGEFNVPIGTKNSVTLATDNFQQISNILHGATIVCCDFEKTINKARDGDFVFVDPPYTVKHNYNGFVKYNEQIFSWEDQMRLHSCIEAAVKRGVKLLITNADHPSIHELYKGTCKIKSVSRSSVIAGSSAHRGKTTEAIMQIGENW